MTACYCVILACFPISADPGRSNGLDGSWRVARDHSLKEPASASSMKYFTISGNQVVFHHSGGGVSYGNYKVNFSNRPWAIDIVGDIARNKDFSFKYRGIVTLNKQSLKICWIEQGQQRPTEFKTKVDKHQYSYVCKRVAWDYQAMQGRWKVVHAESGGKTLAKLIGQIWRFDGRTGTPDHPNVTVTLESDDNRKIFPERKLSLDQFETPAEFSEVLVDTDAAELLPSFTSIDGIYRLQEDRLTLCQSRQGKSRPKRFQTTKGDVRRLYVLERIR